MTAYLETGRMHRPCTCGFNYLFVRSTGEVMLCPLMARSVGNLRDTDIGDIWASEAACICAARSGAPRSAESCTEPQAWSATPYQAQRTLSLLCRVGPSRFLRAPTGTRASTSTSLEAGGRGGGRDGSTPRRRLPPSRRRLPLSRAPSNTGTTSTRSQENE